MATRKQIFQKQSLKEEQLGASVSINDLREREFNGGELTLEERQALRNFDRFRIAELNNQKTDMEFHEKYRHLQVMANLGDHAEFLKAKYSDL